MSNLQKYQSLELKIARRDDCCGACMFLSEFGISEHKCLLFKEKLGSYETYEGVKVMACDDCREVLQT